MTNPNDPAYPQKIPVMAQSNEYQGALEKVGEQFIPGLTKREYFAAMADANWNAVMASLELKGNKKPSLGEMLKARAQIKVMEADALIAELNKAEPK